MIASYVRILVWDGQEQIKTSIVECEEEFTWNQQWMMSFVKERGGVEIESNLE